MDILKKLQCWVSSERGTSGLQMRRQSRVVWLARSHGAVSPLGRNLSDFWGLAAVPKTDCQHATLDSSRRKVVQTREARGQLGMAATLPECRVHAGLRQKRLGPCSKACAFVCFVWWMGLLAVPIAGSSALWHVRPAMLRLSAHLARHPTVAGRLLWAVTQAGGALRPTGPLQGGSV